MKNFRKTLHEEVFSKKVGLNPPLIVNAEEVPIISEMVDSTPESHNLEVKSRIQHHQASHDSEEEVQPENYFFSNDS